MKTKTKKDEKICLACKRILVDESKLGLCPECLNKYGTPVVGTAMGGLILLCRKALKNGGKIAKSVINVAKHIK